MSRILFVIESLAEGGTERSLVELLPGLLAAGHRPKIAVLFHRDGLEDQVRELGIEVLLIPGQSWLGWVLGLRRVLRETAPDLVHSMLFRSDVVSRLATIGTGRRLLGSLVDTPYDPVRSDDPATVAWKLATARHLDAWTGRVLTDHFHAVSETVKRAAVERLRLAPNRITVIPRGRDRDRLGHPSGERRMRARQRLGIRPEERIILNVGRQQFQKGQRHLVAAIPQVIAAEPRAVFLISGRRGGASKEIERLRDELRIGNRLRLLGHRDDVPELLAAADIFVSPTLYEGMPGAILEAMAMGLPIVASNISSVREVVEEGSSLLVERGNEGALGSAITCLLAEPELARRFGERGVEIFDRRFTLEASVEGHLKLYSSLLGHPTRNLGA